MAMLPLILSPDAYTSGPPLKFMVWMTALYASWTLIPITISCAILRRRLWDIDPIINRTLVYGLLSAIVVGFYVLVVAVLFQPLRDRLQKGVNRLLNGDRDDPYAVMTGLGRRPTVVTTIKDALRLPYVAIGLRQDGELQASCCWHPAPRAAVRPHRPAPIPRRERAPMEKLRTLIEATRRIIAQHPSLRVLIVTMFVADASVFSAGCST